MFEKYRYLLSKSPLAGSPGCLLPEVGVVFRNMAPPATHPRVMDLGAGNGDFTVKLRAMGYTVTPVDLDNSQFPENVVAEMHELPFRDNSFDQVFLSGVLEHSFAPFIVLHETNRITRNGGYILITLPAGDNVKMLEDEAHYSIFSRLQMEHMFFKKLKLSLEYYESGLFDQVVGPHQVFVCKVNK